MHLTRIRERILGRPRDPLSVQARHSMALVAFLAWVGLGADGLSSSCYGPEEAFRALGVHTHFGLYLAIATALTVFVVSFAYNQIIELFPNGGGGYRIASDLLGPHSGLVAGSALIVDYVLTIAISVAAGVDALFSLLPPKWGSAKLEIALLLIAILLVLNLRGAKESIRVLLPIFMGFFTTHVLLIVVGVGERFAAVPTLVPDTVHETFSLAGETSWFFVAALFLRAYSLGGGTYTGIEAVSNNVQTLKEPRVETGKLTMFYMALSLSFMAGGILLLYLVRNAAPVEGQTLNAVVFSDVLVTLGFEGTQNVVALTVVLAFEAGLLFVAANTGFLGGPSVLANMAADSWLPHQFRYLSSRLVTQNGLIVMGIAAAAVLGITRGEVSVLVVLYSINVFITFTLALAGLTRHWWRRRRDMDRRRWLARMGLSLLGLSICAGILGVTIVAKFFDGGWLTLGITALVIWLCIVIRKHYDAVKVRIKALDAQFESIPFGSQTATPPLAPNEPTAVFLVGSSKGGGMHALLRVQRMFPGLYRNFIFINARAVDAQSYGGAERLAALKIEANSALSFFVNQCRSNGLAATSYLVFGTDAVEELVKLAERVQKEFPQAVFFTSKIVFDDENWLTQQLHNQAALVIQRRLSLQGQPMVILPLKL
ncbi:MAG TPA: APC family permease [Burkholderiaceae bacterium]|nr:APC family permease [Burkholderiaceae bacterium]